MQLGVRERQPRKAPSGNAYLKVLLKSQLAQYKLGFLFGGRNFF